MKLIISTVEKYQKESVLIISTVEKYQKESVFRGKGIVPFDITLNKM